MNDVNKNYRKIWLTPFLGAWVPALVPPTLLHSYTATYQAAPLQAAVIITAFYTHHTSHLHPAQLSSDTQPPEYKCKGC